MYIFFRVVLNTLLVFIIYLDKSWDWPPAPFVFRSPCVVLLASLVLVVEMGDKSALSEIIMGYVSRLFNSQSWLITRVVKPQIRMSPSRNIIAFWMIICIYIYSLFRYCTLANIFILAQRGQRILRHSKWLSYYRFLNASDWNVALNLVLTVPLHRISFLAYLPEQLPGSCYEYISHNILFTY